MRTITTLLLIFCAPFAWAQSPNAAFTASVTQGCPPLVVNFTDQSTGNPTSWSWDFGVGTSSQRNPSAVFLNPGTYNVRLTVSNAQGTDTEIKTGYIIVRDTPNVVFTATSTQACVGMPVQFTDHSQTGGGSNTYLWDFGDGSPFGTLQNPTHTYTQPGAKTVSLRVTNQWGCARTQTRTQYLQVNPLPTVDFQADKTQICGADTIQFTASVQGTAPYTYLWTFGSLGTSTQANPRFGFPGTPGSHTIQLDVTDARGCVKTVVKNNYISRVQVSGNFIAPASACQGATVNFVGSSTPVAATKHWDFGDNSPSVTGTTRNHVYAQPGNYDVQMIAQAGDCRDTVKKSIQILPKPVADFTAIPQYPCQAPGQVQFTPNGSFASYLWNFGVNPPATSTQSSPSHTYNQYGRYTPTLMVEAANGCRDTVVKPSHVQLHDGFLRLSSNKKGGCVPLTVNFDYKLYSNIPSTNSNYPFAGTAFLWNFRDGYTSTLPSPQHTFQDTGVFMVTLRLTTANGCVFWDSIKIRVGQPPMADFSVLPRQPCLGSPVSFTNLSTGADSFRWEFGDTRTSILESPTHEYDSAGTFDILLTAFHHSCPDTQLFKAWVTVDSPKARFDYKVSCDTTTRVKFKSTSYGETSWIWYFGDNTSNSVDREPLHDYPSEGDYSVMLVTFNSRSGCSDTETVQLSLRLPQGKITASDSIVCPNQMVTFLGERTPPGTAIRRRWSVNGVPLGDTLATIYHNAWTSGTYDLSYSFEDENGCRRVVTVPDMIRVSQPQVDFVADTVEGCDPHSVMFTDLSTASWGSTLVGWRWDFGDGGSQNTVVPHAVHTYTTKGTYDVTLVVTDNQGCTSSLRKPAYIHVTSPEADFLVDSFVCVGAPLAFQSQNLETGPFYWDFGDGNHSTLKNPQHIYSDTGTYTIRYAVANALGCWDTLVSQRRVKAQKPEANFTVSDSLSACLPFPVTMTNTSLKSEIWYWDFGNGLQQTQTSRNTPASVMYTVPGEYTVRLRAVDDRGCVDTAERTIYVLGYSGMLDYTPLTGCAPLDVDFTNRVYNVAQLQYDFDDGSVVSAGPGQAYTHTYTRPGRYRPRLVITDNSGCSVGSEGDKEILIDGIEVDFEHSPPCVGSLVQFRDKSVSHFSPLNHWSWTIDGKTSGQSNTQHRFPQQGSYDLKFVVGNGNGCMDSLVSRFEIYPLPTVDAGEDTLICIGDEAALRATGAKDYQWSPVDLLSCDQCPQPLARPGQETEFVVIGTDARGCSDTDQVRVMVKSHVEAGASGAGEICLGERRKLQAWGGDSYQWTPTDGLTSPDMDSTWAEPGATTRYQMVAYEGACIPDTHYLTVTVHPLPYVEASGSSRTVAGNEVPIQAQGRDIESFQWTPSATLSCSDCSSPIARPLKSTQYTVIVTNEYGCLDSASVRIEVFCDQSQVFLPNTFTPNGDGQNDRFYPRGVGLTEARVFRIYNRWGELVFEKRGLAFNDPYAGWDGTFQGNPLAPDVFVWFLEAACESGEAIQLKGDISLIR